MGTAVVGGMLAATLIAILVIPTLYVFSQRLFGKEKNVAAPPSEVEQEKIVHEEPKALLPEPAHRDADAGIAEGTVS